MGGGHGQDGSTLGGEPTFLRLDDYGSTVLVEVDADGFAVREVVLATDGRPMRSAAGPAVTDYAYDYAIPALWPGTPDFDAHFRGRWAAITGQEFEAAYERARRHPLRFRELPRDDQLRQIRGCLIITVVGLVALFVVLFAMAIFMQLLAVVLRTIFGWSY
jgi:hypothetical protein